MSKAFIRGGAPPYEQIGKSAIIAIILILLAFLIFYVIYHIYNLIMKTSLSTTTLLRVPTRVYSTSSAKEIATDGSVPVPINGKEYSYSFWMYIENFVSGNLKHVFSRGNSAAFLMSSSANQLEVFVALGNTYSFDTDYMHNDQFNMNNPKYLRIVVDYIPIQRWVNVSLVVDNEFLTVFLDGDINTVVNLPSGRIVGNSKGSFSISSRGGFPSIDGIVSNAKFFNYAITVNDARALYGSGPSNKNILTLMGLPLYGIRNPFYRVDTIEDVKELEGTTVQ
jgi:hypothetical protein